MAVHDFWHERLLSICAIFGLAAVLSPVMVLFGVKNGIITTMMNRLVEDPRNLEITPVGSGQYTFDWIEKLKTDPRIAFIVPQTRSISATITLVGPERESGLALTVDLTPTASGDPVMHKWGRVPEVETEIALSESAARKLKVKPGDRLSGRVGRTNRGAPEQALVPLVVACVLPLVAQQKDTAYVLLPLLEAVERYRDGRSVERFGWTGTQWREDVATYPSFRLYAGNIEMVGGLRSFFESRGVEVYTRAEEIEVVQSLDRSFTIIFRLVSSAAVIGFLAAMTSNVLASVRRKERSIGVIRLIGFPTGGIVLFPVTQSILVGLLGLLVSVSAYSIVAFAIDTLFSGRLHMGEAICSMRPAHFLATAGIVLCVSVLASLTAAFNAARIEPSEVIRDV